MRVTPLDGTAFDLGIVEERPTIGMTDFSRRETDAFGVTTVVRRDFARRMTVRLLTSTSQIDDTARLLVALRAKPALWEADNRYAWLSVTGYYDDLSIDLPSGEVSYCTLTVAGLAEKETVADTGIDPTANGRPSTLRFVEPIPISDVVLVSSSISESDAAAWAATTSYPQGASVVRGHRLFESLVSANIGADPLTTTGKWVDTGPTNRWAMFDQALGSATIASDPIVLVLAPGVALSALALLDTNAATVRVQAGSYDRTVVPDAAGKALFLDFAAPANASVTVTVTPSAATPRPKRWDDGAQWRDADAWRDSLAAGDGTVTIGTFLFGALKGLGTTEASPTAGITDYSLKDTDEFGEATVVERAWAKNMAVKAQIASSAIDVVANRIASVRARPALWIGDTVRDSLVVYGFFRDFSIEVGQTVSKLSLLIEGLSKAAPVEPESPLSIAWPDITDPTGTKPTNNADKTSENTSKDTAAVGGKPATQVLSDIDAAIARANAIENVTIPAINQAVAGANTAIATAQGKADLAKTNADQALANIISEADRLDTRIDSVTASGGYDDTAVKAEVHRIDEAAIGRDAALGTRIDSVSAELVDTDLDLRALVRTTDQAAVDREHAIAQRVDELIAQGGGGSEGIDSVARSEISRVEQAAITRDTALGTRVDNVSASIGPAVNAKATEITTAYTQADLALSRRADTLEAVAQGGGNLVPNSALATLDGWGLTFNPDAASTMSLNGAGAPWMIGGVENNLTLFRSPAGNGLCAETLSARFAVRPGSTVQFYALTANHRCNVWTSLFFFRADGSYAAYAGEFTSPRINEGGQSINGWEITGSKAVAVPGDVVAACFVFRIYNVSSDGYGWMSRPFVTEVQPGANTWAPYAPGNDRTVIASVSSRVSSTEATLADLPNRYAAASRAATLEAQLAYQAPSGMSGQIARIDGKVDSTATTLIARIEDRATAIADAKTGAVAQTVQQLRSEYNGTVATVSQQAGTIVDLQGRASAYVRFLATAGNGRAQLTLSADANGGGGADLVGDLSVSGNLLVGGSVITDKVALNAVTSAGSVVGGARSFSTAYALVAELNFNVSSAASQIIVLASGTPLISSGAVAGTYANLLVAVNGQILLQQRVGTRGNIAQFTFILPTSGLSGVCNFQMTIGASATNGQGDPHTIERPTLVVQEFKR